MMARWKHRKQFGEQRGPAIDASVPDCEPGDVLTSALHTSQPPPRSLRQAVKPLSSANVSEGGVIPGRLAAVDKYWKCYPSLKHHSFTYCKCASLWAPSPHCWRGGRQHPAASAMSEHHRMQPQTRFSLLKLQRTDCASQLDSRL